MWQVDVASLRPRTLFVRAGALVAKTDDQLERIGCEAWIGHGELDRASLPHDRAIGVEQAGQELAALPLSSPEISSWDVLVAENT